MANKKAKTNTATGRKHASARQAYKRKQKSATKFRNDQLRENLDRQAQAVYVTPQLPISQSSGIPGLQKSDSLNDLLNSFTSTSL